MRPHQLRALGACLLLAACGAPGDAGPSASAPFEAVTDVQGIMSTIVDPAADVYWDAVGWILDSRGVTEIHPETEEEWVAVRNAAYLLAESGNLLMMQGRGIDDPAWIPMARALVDVGRIAIEAAESRDDQRVFDAGAEVYYVCSNCHSVFALEPQPPSPAPGS